MVSRYISGPSTRARLPALDEALRSAYGSRPRTQPMRSPWKRGSSSLRRRWRCGWPSRPVTERVPKIGLTRLLAGLKRHLVVAGEDLVDQLRAGDPDCPSEAQEVDGGRTVHGVALLAALEEGERIRTYLSVCASTGWRGPGAGDRGQQGPSFTCLWMLSGPLWRSWPPPHVERTGWTPRPRRFPLTWSNSPKRSRNWTHVGSKT